MPHPTRSGSRGDPGGKTTAPVLDPLDAPSAEDGLARLQLNGIRDQLDNLLDEAARANLSAREALALPCEREIARKDHRRIDPPSEAWASSSPTSRLEDLASFDYEAQPSVDPKQIRDLAARRWIANGENLLLLGPPGVGKTHLAPGSPSGLPLGVVAIALGREAILAGYAVQFVAATTLVAALAKAHAERRLEERLTNLAKPRLLIVDELVYLPLEPDAAHLFFELVSRRYEKGAMLITSNRTISEWGTVFGDAVVATAILDPRGPREACFAGWLPPPPQPRRYHRRRQLPASRRAPQWASAEAHCGAAHRHRHSLTERVSSSCRQGVNFGCRLTGGGAFLGAVAVTVMRRPMAADVEGMIGAGRHERTPERATCHNGNHERSLDTRLGSSQPRPQASGGQLLAAVPCAEGTVLPEANGEWQTQNGCLQTETMAGLRATRTKPESERIADFAA